MPHSVKSGANTTMLRYQSKAKKEKEIYAVKIQSKYKLTMDKQQEHVLNEIKCMNVIEHPFILDLRGVAQDKRCLYMFIDFMPNGDLMKVINHFTQIDVKLARFYFAQILMSLEYLHAKNMVYRDLKPENILL